MLWFLGITLATSFLFLLHLSTYIVKNDVDDMFGIF